MCLYACQHLLPLQNFSPPPRILIQLLPIPIHGRYRLLSTARTARNARFASASFAAACHCQLLLRLAASGARAAAARCHRCLLLLRLTSSGARAAASSLLVAAVQLEISCSRRRATTPTLARRLSAVAVACRLPPLPTVAPSSSPIQAVPSPTMAAPSCTLLDPSCTSTMPSLPH